ncbi:hypothetical protein AC579_4058 [Pseudocercospora musae]|uniref:Zn(2)-C6 fungal-type domain-containing protein n=1 Tax=Pseudocercospora musae TaxID=113226 RepID=A0A139IDX7_9PEZI|nr:hypothetical protein AC579_4058 [Pseudocercospora musae]
MDIQQKQNDMAKATLATFELRGPVEVVQHREKVPSPIKYAAETCQAEFTTAERPCDACRSRKKRCDKLRPQCSACVKRKITCHYSEPRRPLKRKRTASKESNQTTTRVEISRDGDVESLHETRETSPSTRLGGPEAEVVADTKETDYILDEEQIAQMPYWKWMDRRRAFDAEMERASEKLREEGVGRPRKDRVTGNDVEGRETPEPADKSGLRESAVKAIPPERTAAQRVFGTYELFEMILLEADMKTVLFLQRVNKTFQHVINRSTALQQKLFFGPCHSDVWASNPLFLESRYSTRLLKARAFAFKISSNGTVQESGRFGLPDALLRSCENGSWRKMLVAHPLPRRLHVVRTTSASHFGGFAASGTIKHSQGREIRMGALLEELLRQQRTTMW